MSKSNRNRANHLVASALVCAAIGLTGCRKLGEPAEASTGDVYSLTASAPAKDGSATRPATAPAVMTFDDKKDGVQLQFTSDWVSKPDKDYVLQLVPAGGEGDRRITFDIPDLPPHFPGMIRLGLIENGYVKDLKETHKDARTEKSADHPMGQGCKARLVESSWTEKGAAHKCAALLMMRNDHVYILACDSDVAHADATRGDFEKVKTSLKWTK